MLCIAIMRSVLHYLLILFLFFLYNHSYAQDPFEVRTSKTFFYGISWTPVAEALLFGSPDMHLHMEVIRRQAKRPLLVTPTFS